ITCFLIFWFFNISSYLSEAVCPCLLLALTSAHFDDDRQTLSAWPIAGISVSLFEWLLSFGSAPCLSLIHVRFAAKSGPVIETFLTKAVSAIHAISGGGIMVSLGLWH